MPTRLDGALGLEASALAALAAALAVFLTSAAGAWLLLRFRYGTRALLRRRAQLLTRSSTTDERPHAEPRANRRPLKDKLRDLEARRRRPARVASVRRLLREAGLDISPARYFVLSALPGAVAMGVAFIVGASTLVASIVGAASALALPRWFVRHLGRRRRNAFTRDFAGALDVIVRGIQSGLPIEECFAIIAHESPDPVGLEFRLILEAQRLGLSQEDAIQRAYERLPTPELKFFATVLAIQRQTGGSLAETLTNLSRVLRDRRRMAGKVRALSSEARASAAIIGALPVLVAGLLCVVNLPYISLLVADPIGYLLVAVGALAMALGTFVMRRMIRFEI